MHTSTLPAADVVVVGGGIVGTASAAFLARAGLRVVLIEREGLASGASGANSGVVQQPFDPVLAGIYHATVALYRDLATMSTAFRMPDAPVGMLFVAESEASARRQAEMVAELSPELATEVVGGAELQALEPTVGSGLWACHVDIGYPVAPGAPTYAYATLAEAGGAEIRQGRAAALEVQGDLVTGVRVDGRRLAAGAVLVAAGPWTPGLIDPSGRWVPIRPLWGAVVEVELAQPPRHVLEQAGIQAAIGGAVAQDVAQDELHFSLVPLPGVSVVGSTFVVDEPEPRAWVEPILERAARFVPSVADAPIRGAHACARPQSVDGRPLIGAVPGRRGLYVCAGHGPWGISTGPGSAQLVAELILGRASRVPAELDAGRFGEHDG